ncbi:MAG: AzlD domain-containing protein [Bacillota bacterium]
MRASVLLLFLGMALVTYLPRMAPLVILSRLQLPSWFVRWLGCVPVAVMAALLAPALLLRPEGATSVLWLSWDNHGLLAALPTFAVALRTRNIFATVVTGLAVVFLLNSLGRW